MDIEKLTKTQIVLLALLVSFVTSIATGIITASLLQQAPPAVTQTINRVVEKTVERVVEKDTSKGGEPKVVTKEKVVLVKEADVVADAVKSAVPALVSIYTTSPADEKKAETPSAEGTKTETIAPVQNFVSRGIFVGGSIVATDAAKLSEGKEYVVRSLASGTDTKVKSVKISEGIAYLTLDQAVGAPLILADEASVQLGQTLIVLGGEGRLRVTTGIVSDIDRTAENTFNSLSVGTEGTSGSALITMDGKLVAVSLSGVWTSASHLVK